MHPPLSAVYAAFFGSFLLAIYHREAKLGKKKEKKVISDIFQHKM
jgi:hypothetical protein